MALSLPTRMIPGSLSLGVDSLKALTPERIHLKPVNQALGYTPAGINKRLRSAFLRTVIPFWMYRRVFLLTH